MSLLEMLQCIWFRRVRFLVTFLSILALTLLLTLIWPKSYMGVASIVVNAKAVDPLTGASVPAELLPTALNTEIQVIASRNVALKVIDRYHLTQSPLVRERWLASTDGQGSIRDWLALKMLDKLDVKPANESNVIDIRYPADDPDNAALLTNAFADAYIQTSLELEMEPARRQASWFDSQLAELRKRLEDAQKRLSDFQEKKQIIGTDDRLDIETEKLTEIGNQLVLAQAAMYDAQTRQRQMTQALDRGQIEQVPDILQNPLLQSMKADLVRAEAKLAEVAQKYGKNHPQFISASAEVAELHSKLTNEMETARGSIDQASQLSQRRVAEVQRGLDEQKNRILALKQQHDDRDVLSQLVVNAQHAYDVAAQRASELSLQSRMNQSSVALLNPANPPVKATWPKPLLNLFLAVVLGTIFAAGYAIWSEARDARVRAAESLTAVTGLAVFAVIPKGRATRRLRFFRGRRRFAQLAAQTA